MSVARLPILDSYKKFLVDDNDAAAWAVIREYFEIYDGNGAEEDLWFILSTALKTDNEELTPFLRSTMINFFEYFKLMNGALYQLCQKKFEAEKPKKV